MFEKSDKLGRVAVTVVSVVGLTLGGAAVLGVSAAGARAVPSASAAVAVNRVNVRTTKGVAQVSRTATTTATATVRGGGSTLAGVEVTFSVDRGFVGTTATPDSTTTTSAVATTDQFGVATVYIGSTTAGLQTLTGTAEAVSDLATKTYAADPATVTLAPADATIEAGRSADFTATVDDGAGAPVSGASVGFAATGPGTLSGPSGTTGADGTATVTLATAKTDTVGATGTVTASVSGVEQSASSTYDIGAVVVGAPSTMIVASDAFAGQVSTTDTTVATATVTDDDGDAVADQDVTFSVDLGFVSPTPTPTPDVTTVVARTDADGVATVHVGSTTAGTQTITGSLGALSGTASKTYYANPASITLAPDAARVVAGTKQVFTATVLDAVGKPSPGAGVTFTNGDGPGVLNRTAVTTDADGRASVTLTTATDDLGAGTVTASTFIISGGGPATVGYTVTAPVVISTVAVSLLPVVKAGATQVATVTVTNSDGSAPAAGLEVDVLVSGATKDNGTVLTDAHGVATFGFPAQHAGAFLVKAVAGGRSGTASATTPVRNVVTTLSLASPSKGLIVATAKTSPARPGQVIAFYYVQGGKYVAYHNVKADASGTAVINSPGRGTGVTYTLAARLINDPDSDSVYSASKSIRSK